MKTYDYPIGDILEKEIWYIKAKLCSGDEDQSPELEDALRRYSFNEKKLMSLNRLCARIADLVLSLLRVHEMNRQINKVFEK